MKDKLYPNNDIINHFLKRRELVDLEERIERIEERLETSRQMTNGLCDLEGCQDLPLLGRRPLTERIGRKIREKHWRRHRDEKDSFDLFDELKFRRPAGISKLVVKNNAPRCTCGRELPPGRRLCTACAAERKRQRNKQYYHVKKDHQAELINESTMKCKQCGGPRLPDHIYCSKCAKRRKIITRRKAQSHYWRKQQNVRV